MEPWELTIYRPELDNGPYGHDAAWHPGATRREGKRAAALAKSCITTRNQKSLRINFTEMLSFFLPFMLYFG
jgi:hypothetical protein